MVAHAQNITCNFFSGTGRRQRVLWIGVIIGMILFNLENCKILSTRVFFHCTWIRYLLFLVGQCIVTKSTVDSNVIRYVPMAHVSNMIG